MKNILRIVFGSSLYGTSTPKSDIDYKSIFIPSGRDIVLQRVKHSINPQRPKSHGEKNYAGEIDEESFSLQKYLSLLAEGQTVAMDMLFAPKYAFIEEPDEIWNEIVSNKDRLLTKKSKSFVGYCQQQASKYGVKGDRLKAARAANEFLEECLAFNTGKTRLSEFESAMITITNKHQEYMKFVPIDQPNSSPINHWEVCGRKLPFNTSINNAYQVINSLVSDYGARTVQAEKDGGVDWKAMSHAVRIANQAVEFLETGRILFPLLKLDRVMDIKLGKVPYKEVGEEIEDLLKAVEFAAENSNLPEEPDYQWIDDFVYRVYKKEILENV